MNRISERNWSIVNRQSAAALVLLCLLAMAAFADAAFADAAFKKDVIYYRVPGKKLKMDIATPSPGAGPAPAIVCIHGGAWEVGDKDEYAPFLRLLAARGYAAASIQYRLAPKYTWPAQIEDCKRAVRYLRAHAKRFNIDPERVVALGDSAGGHLALLLGLMDPKDGLEGRGFRGQSSKVQAVVNLYGPTDLKNWRLTPEVEAMAREEFGKTIAEMMVDVMGTADRTAPVFTEMSPINYVDAGDPPVLTFHGDADFIVPLDHANVLHAALDKAEVPNQLVVIPNAGHGLDLEKIAPQIFGFLEQQLPRKQATAKTP